MKKELEEARAKLEEREICLEESGSLAEAALRLNGIFDAAEEAARQKADAYWQEVSSRLQSFYQEHEALKELLAQGGHP